MSIENIDITEENKTSLLSKINKKELLLDKKVKSKLFSGEKIFARFPREQEIEDGTYGVDDVVYRLNDRIREKTVGTHMHERTVLFYDEFSMDKNEFLSKYGMLPDEKTRKLRLDFDDIIRTDRLTTIPILSVGASLSLDATTSTITDIDIPNKVKKQTTLNKIKSDGHHIDDISSPSQEELKTSLKSNSPTLKSYSKIKTPNDEDKIAAVKINPDIYKKLDNPPAEATLLFIKEDGANLKNVKKKHITSESMLLEAVKSEKPNMGKYSVVRDIMKRFSPSDDLLLDIIKEKPFSIKEIQEYRSLTDEMKMAAVSSDPMSIELIANPNEELRDIFSRKTAMVHILDKLTEREIRNSFAYVESSFSYLFERTGKEKKIDVPGRGEVTVFEIRHKDTKEIGGFIESPELLDPFGMNDYYVLPKNVNVILDGNNPPLRIGDQSFKYGWSGPEITVKTEEDIKNASTVSYYLNMRGDPRPSGEKMSLSAFPIKQDTSTYKAIKEIVDNGDIEVPFPLDSKKYEKVNSSGENIGSFLLCEDIALRNVDCIKDLAKLIEEESTYISVKNIDTIPSIIKEEQENNALESGLSLSN